MKKIALSLALIAGVSSANAADYYVGGGVSHLNNRYSANDSGVEKATTNAAGLSTLGLFVNAGINQTVKKNWVLGGELQLGGNLGSADQMIGSTKVQSSNPFTVNLLGKAGYKLSSDFTAYGLLGAAYDLVSTDQTVGNAKTSKNYSYFAPVVGVGFTKALCEKWSLDVKYLYTTSAQKNDGMRFEKQTLQLGVAYKL